MRRTTRVRSAVGCVAVAMGLFLTATSVPAASAAGTESPWWHLTQRVIPTQIKPGVAQNEVQEIFTEPGEFNGHAEQTNFNVSVGGAFIEEFSTEPVAGEFGLAVLSAANIQTALAEPTAYGPGNVTVEEVSLDKAGNPLQDGDLRYLITTIGEKGSQAVGPLGVHEEIGTAKAAVLTPGRPDGKLAVAAFNLGDAPASGPLTITDTLPPGFALEGLEFLAPNTPFGSNQNLIPIVSAFYSIELCHTTTTTVTTVTCSISQEFIETGAPTPLSPFQELTMILAVKAEPGAEPAGLNEFTASGAATVPATLKRPVPVGTGPIPFGLESFSLTPEEEGGALATRAGSHPFQLTTDVAFNHSSPEPLKRRPCPATSTSTCPPASSATPSPPRPAPTPTSPTRLPPPAPTSAPPTPRSAPPASPSSPATPGKKPIPSPSSTSSPPSANPPASASRWSRTRSSSPPPSALSPARAAKPPTTASPSASRTSPRSPPSTPPPSPSGARPPPTATTARAAGAAISAEHEKPCEPTNDPKPTAFLTLPTDCAHPFDPLFEGVSWPTQAAPEGFQAEPLDTSSRTKPATRSASSPATRSPSTPAIEAEPTSDAATSPTGLNFEINFEDEGLISAEGVAQSQMKKAVVTLPQGFTTNPSVAEGLKACSEAEYESTTVDSGSGCPENSKVGEVEIESPLVERRKSSAPSTSPSRA